MSITVIDVMRQMKVEITPKLSWSIGEQVRAFWVSVNGKLPDKELRAKTTGGGTHCFAVYPDSMWSHIERIVKQYQEFAAKQMDLFADARPKPQVKTEQPYDDSSEEWL